MITSLVFSKNRPLQLDLCLNSVKNNFIDCKELYVLQNYCPQYQDSLNIIRNDHKNVCIIQQSNSIYEDVLNICESSANDYICLFTDDDIVYSKFSISGYDQIFAEKNAVCCVSLRLGLNIKHRSHLGMKVDDLLKSYSEIENFLCVAKSSHYYGSYWSYSHSLDGHIFRKKDLQKMLKEISILDKHMNYAQTPNELEAQMQKYWTNSYNRIITPKQSVVVNSPNNRVSSSHQDNLSGEKYFYDIDTLYNEYISGKRININLLDFNDITCPHTEINLIKGLS